MVCSLEKAKELKEAGVKQISKFYWFRDCMDENFNLIFLEEFESHGMRLRDGFYYSAFLISELLEMLTNEEIKTYLDRGGHYLDDKYRSIGNLLDLFYSPNALAEVVLWKLGKEKK